MVFETTRKQIYPLYLRTNLTVGVLDSSDVTEDGIEILNFQAGKLGSTNGSTYGTDSYILIPMGSAGYSQLAIRMYLLASFNQDVTLEIFEYFNTVIPITAGYKGGQMLSITLPSGQASQRFSISDGTVGQGGQSGGATVTPDDHFRMVIGTAVPYVVLHLHAGSAPSSGVCDTLTINRSA